ncbi:nitroreductase family protein [Azospirillum halopraeferens]|uniref:nitroreductase family protein n=1 Tax=Azospirillum halopraeferens TaxID=34010 RepID=UPI000414F869|nr:nitroreductase family protein [Azospirillum halopraeferens]
MSERVPAHPVDPLFPARWSPRAFDAADMPESDLLTMLEAARWAPSAFNYQPWRFLYARRGDAHWADFLDLLLPGNARWARDASALVFVLSDTRLVRDDSDTPAYTHSFDTGAAWAQLALQAIRLGYHAHGMAGIDFDRARARLAVPERFRIEMAAAIGRRADPATLPDDLRAREQPSPRRPLEAIAYPGPFRG